MLNALRHQRSFQTNSLPYMLKTLKVLNALRHQRSFQARGVKLCGNCIWCSTPCGIKDHFRKKAHANVPTGVRAQRLAASKIISEAVFFGATLFFFLCSTPCGIKDHFSVTAVASVRDHYLCSTPCGIKDHFRCIERRLSHPTYVLNALRHQRSFQRRG